MLSNAKRKARRYQLGCDEGTALEALRTVAAAAEERLENVAVQVFDGSVRFVPRARHGPPTGWKASEDRAGWKHKAEHLVPAR
jgi:hypothetical protein